MVGLLLLISIQGEITPWIINRPFRIEHVGLSASELPAYHGAGGVSVQMPVYFNLLKTAARISFWGVPFAMPSTVI